MSILLFLVSAIVSIADPISLVGYILAGSLIRNYWGTVVVGVLWRIAAHLVFVVPASQVTQSSTSLTTFIAALFGAFLATSIVWLIANRVRRRKTTSSSGEAKEAVPTPPNQYGILFEDGSYTYGSYRFDSFSKAAAHARHVESLQTHSKHTPPQFEESPAPEEAVQIEAAPEPPIENALASIAGESATLSIEQQRAVLAVIRSMKPGTPTAP